VTGRQKRSSSIPRKPGSAARERRPLPIDPVSPPLGVPEGTETVTHILYDLSTPEATHEALTRPDLSFRARGLLAYLLTQPDDLILTPEGLSEQGREGQKAVRVALRALTDAGYIRRERYRGERGRWCYRTVITNRPGA
jgi:hypothetical protein